MQGVEASQDQGRPSQSLGDAIPFPHPTVRRGQGEFLRDARRALAEGKHLVAHAPTGLGKTAAALVAALEVAEVQDRRVLFLTAKQSQHRMAIGTLQAMARSMPHLAVVDTISKQAMCLVRNNFHYYGAFHEFCNYMVKTHSCRFYNRNSEAVAETLLRRPIHVEETIGLARAQGTCPHKAAMEAAGRARVLVCDYNYLFSDIADRILQHLRADASDLLLVVDEAHNLPDRIRSQASLDLRPADVEGAAREARAMDRRVAQRLQRFADLLGRALAPFTTEVRVDRDLLLGSLATALRSNPSRSPELVEFVAEVEALGERVVALGGPSNLLDLALFLQRWTSGGDEYLRTASPASGGLVSLQLLDPAVVSREVFAAVHGSVLMSGTLHPGTMYADLLGLEEERRVVRSYRSDFPADHRPLLATPHLTSLYGRRDEDMFREYARGIAMAVGATPGNAAAFFPSYEFLARVLEPLRLLKPPKALAVEGREQGKAEREALVQRLRAARGSGGALLLGVLGGGLSEGVDYEDNLLSLLIVVGLPISPPTVAVEALRDYYTSRFGRYRAYEYAYLNPALNKVMQAAGRCIRDASDRAVVALLDHRYLDPRYYRHLPDDFRPTPTHDLAGEVARFFSGPPDGTVRAP